MTAQAPSSKFRTESRLEAFARVWPSSGALGRLRRWLKPLFETAVGWRGAGAVESRLPGGEIVRVRPAWRHVTWNPDEYAAFRAATRPGDVVIEAGANAGAYAVLFGQWVGPSGRVYAFEPDPRAFAALADHVALNGVADRVVPIGAAVVEQPGNVRLQLAPSSGLSRVAGTRDDVTESVDVDGVSIDEFCARLNITPALLKIDVEGAELGVLRGARRTIAAAGPALHLFVEMHPALWKQSAITAADLVRECSASSLTIERLDGSRDRLFDVEGVCLRLRHSGATK